MPLGRRFIVPLTSGWPLGCTRPSAVESGERARERDIKSAALVKVQPNKVQIGRRAARLAGQLQTGRGRQAGSKRQASSKQAASKQSAFIAQRRPGDTWRRTSGAQRGKVARM